MSGTDLLLVDWLPRGGITQSTAAWRDVARTAGLGVTVVGRDGDELGPDVAVARRLPAKLGALEAHRRLVQAAVRTIRAQRPSVVYIQHTWVPVMEQPVLTAAAAVGARTVLAVHNALPHQRLAGLRIGMQRLLDRADRLVAHSHHVADRLGRPVEVVGLPEHMVVTRALSASIGGLERRAPRRAVAFGVLGRSYKGAGGLDEVAAALGAQWEVVAAGVGAPHGGPNLRVCDRYLMPGELRWLVETADVVLLPYRSASQSGAVDVAQSLGTPPIASAVGGIPEQIADERFGALIPPDADPATWGATIERTVGAIDRTTLRAAAAAHHAESQHRWLSLVTRPTTDAAR